MKPDGNLGYDYQVIFNQFVQLKQVSRVVFPPTRNASCFIVALMLIINRYFECTMKPDLHYYLNENISVMLEILNKKYEL